MCVFSYVFVFVTGGGKDLATAVGINRPEEKPDVKPGSMRGNLSSILKGKLQELKSQSFPKGKCNMFMLSFLPSMVE